MYEAGEDSFLIGKYIKKFSKGKVLEIGCGSGYLMEIALSKTKNVKGVDIDKESVEFCRKKGLDVSYSDLFSNVKGKFDVIIFNPPYLPQEEPFLKRNVRERKNLDIIGGKRGYEVIERFFKDVKDFLKEKGEILILFSSLTNKEKVDSIIKENNFKFELLEEKSVGLMEKLYVYRCYRKR
ncbi:MAG: DUF2431 domain-containing protein [Nanoarchaeota archaeon]|nr:DUF2431 domain-containing protein [Nanoarchaeota archaeon]